MKTRLLVVLAACALVTLLPSIVTAQQPHPGASHDKEHKVRNKAGVQRVRDKPKPVRAALEQQYAKMVAAYHEETPEVILELRTPDFAVDLPTGDQWNAERSAAYVLASFQQVERTLAASFTIGPIDVRGDTAAAVIYQRWSRQQRMRDELRRVETSACHRETWLNTVDGWRLHRIDNVQPLVWRVDGKRVNPTQPFDPDAPAYAPEIEPVSPCNDMAAAAAP